jgi:transcriptional regulator with XRE-family HTH domain
MTPIQSRMARAALDWSTTDLARAANVGVNSVNRFETGRDSRISTVEKLRSALEAAGVLFIAENGGGAGVRFRESKARKQTEA